MGLGHFGLVEPHCVSQPRLLVTLVPLGVRCRVRVTVRVRVSLLPPLVGDSLECDPCLANLAGPWRLEARAALHVALAGDFSGDQGEAVLGSALGISEETWATQGWRLVRQGWG